MTHSIRNWKKFQHFKDRRPPWIKLYRDLLDDPDWHGLDGEDAKALVMLWLIASEDDGRLPNARKLAFRLRTTPAKADQLLNRLQHWLVQDDITVISPRYHDDTPETETETQEKTETDIRAVAEATRPDEHFEKFWKTYPRRDGANPKTPARKKFFAAAKSGVPAETIIAAARRYSAECQSKQQIGTPYVAQAVTWLNQQRWGDYAPQAETTHIPTPPSPDLPSDDELRRKYGAPNGRRDEAAETTAAEATTTPGGRSDNAGNVLPEGGANDRDDVPVERSNDSPGRTRMRGVGEILRGSSTLAAVGLASASERGDLPDDGSVTVAGVVRH